MLSLSDSTKDSVLIFTSISAFIILSLLRHFFCDSFFAIDISYIGVLANIILFLPIFAIKKKSFKIVAFILGGFYVTLLFIIGWCLYYFGYYY